MGARRGALAERAIAGRTWLRERGLVTLAAAVLLEVSAAAPGGRPSSRAALRALALVLLLFAALLATAVDGILSLLVDGIRGAWLGGARVVRISVLGIEAAAVAIPGSELLGKSGKPLRGAARAQRVAAIERERQRVAYARSLRGRAAVMRGALTDRIRPYAGKVASVPLAIETRALAARGSAIASVRWAIRWTAPRLARIITPFLTRIVAPLVAHTTRLSAWTRSQTTPRIARLRRELAASRVRAAAALRTASTRTARAIARARARALAVPLPRVHVPFPSLSLRTLRIVTVGVTLSFVFATAIGTTGLMAQRGTVALGASTTLTIISGEVSVLASGASEFAPAADGEILQAGMTIRTSANAYAILTYFEGSTVSVDPETTLVIEALQAHPDGSTVIEMRQDVGRTWHAVAKLLTPGSKYTVRTPTATASVRGTLFLVGVEEDEQGVQFTSIETTEGAVAAERAPTAAAPQGEEVIVAAGFKVEAKAAEAIPVAVPVPEPAQKVTVTSTSSNTVVRGPDNRPNGVVNGRVLVTTPGANVEQKPDGSISVTFRNVQGKISTEVLPTTTPPGAAPQPPAPVRVVTVVSEKGKGETRSEETVQPTTTGSAVTGVELKKSADPEKPVELRKLDETEKQSVPTVKLPDPPKPEPKPAQDAKKGDGERSDKSEAAPAPGGGVKNAVQSFVQLTLPPLSAEELAKREAERKKADEKARQEAARRDDERRAEEKKKIEELRQAEERAKAEAARLAEERKKAEERAGDERKKSEDRGREQTERRDEEKRSQPESAPPPAPVAAIQQIFKAIAPQGDDAPKRQQDDRSRDAEKQAEEARKAEAKAKDEAQKAEEARRKAEERDRQDSIKREEEKRRESEKKAEELRRAEEKAKEEAQRKLEELRRIEEKAREQAAKLDDDRRREAERRLEDFRRQEERARQEEARRVEEMRRAEERAKDEAERRLRELREQEERARAEERRRDEERRRQEDRRRDEERTRFVPTETLRPLPGVGSRSTDEEAGTKPRGDGDAEVRGPKARGDR